MEDDHANLRTIIRQPDTMLLFGSTKRYRDANYAFTRGPRGDGLRGTEWRAFARHEEESIRDSFGCLPEWPGEVVER